MDAKKLIRTAQTRVPQLVDAKFAVQRISRRLRRRPSEATYRIFGKFPFTPGACFLDIGANRGQTIDSFRLYNSSTPVVSFEPNPLLAARLASRHRTHPQVVIHPFGLGPVAGEMPLYIPSYNRFRFDGLASLDRTAASEWLGPRTLYRFDPDKLTIETVTCEIRPWDSVDTTPGLVKIDVQGSAVGVLTSGADTIERHRPCFVIENERVPPGSDALMSHHALLAELGYEIAGYDDDRLTMGRVGHLNSIFIPEEKVSALLRIYC